MSGNNFLKSQISEELMSSLSSLKQLSAKCCYGWVWLTVSIGHRYDEIGFWWSRFFVVEPTAGGFGCRRKNVDNKPWDVDIRTRRQFVQHNGCKRLRVPLPHSSRIISDEKRRVGGLSQQEQRNR